MAFGLGRGGRELTLRIVSDTAAINKSTAATAKGIGAINKQISGLGATFAGFFAVEKVADFLIGAADAAREDAAAQRTLENQIRNNIDAWDGNTDAIDKQIEAMAKLGIADDEVRAGLQLLLPWVEDLNSALNINAVAADVAAAKGISQADAAEKIVKALSGQERAQKDLYGGRTFADGMTATQMLAEINLTYAGTASAATDRLKVLQVQADETYESLGKLAVDFAGWFVDEWDAATNRIWNSQHNDTWFRGLPEEMRRQLEQAQQNVFREGERPVNVNLPVNLKAVGPDGESAPVVQFPDLQFSKRSDWVDDYISSVTEYFEKPSVKRRLKTFFGTTLPDLIEKYNIKPGSAKEQDFISTTVQGMLDGNIKESDLKNLDRKLREKVEKAFTKAKDAMKDKNRETMETAIRDAIPNKIDDVYVPVTITAYPLTLKMLGKTFTVKGSTVVSGGGGGQGMKIKSLPVGDAGSAASSVVVNINTGVGDPVAIGREVSRALGAYSTRSGHV